MDEKTLLAIVRRMDDMERRLMGRIDSLDAFRYKVVGGAVFVSGLISVLLEVFKH